MKKRKLENLKYRRGIGTWILFKSEAKRWPISPIRVMNINWMDRSIIYCFKRNNLLITFAYKFCGLVFIDLHGVFGVNDWNVEMAIST